MAKNLSSFVLNARKQVHNMPGVVQVKKKMFGERESKAVTLPKSNHGKN